MDWIKVKLIIISWLFFLLSASSCEKDESSNNADGNEMVFFNGEIYTVNPAQPMAQAILIKDGIIKYVGTNEEAKNMASDEANLIDLNGKFMMPGIHDVHMHPLEASSNNFNFILDENINDPEDYISDIENASQQTSGNGWVLGWGHYLETILAATRPPKEIIDDVVFNRPVAIMEQTSHSIWCNSKALEIMGISSTSNNPIGGIIMRDSNGEPNGILIDNAGNLLIEEALQPTSQSEQNDYDGLVEYGLPELAKHGITSVCDARTYWKRNHHVTWKRLAEEGKLTARVNLGLWAYPSEDDATQIPMLKSLFENDENSLLKINQIKLYSDGIVHNTTCAMHDDFLVDYFGGATNNGLNYFTEERLGEYILALESEGFDFHIHAIGNRGIHEALNAIQENGSAVGRHRLTHVEFMDEIDTPRFSELNVTADAQVAGDFTQPEHWHDNDYLVGTTLSNNIIPLKNLLNSNARITLSSDWDVSTLNPFVGLQNAVTRSPQNISIEEAIKAYTLNGAYIMRQEDKVGSIEIGKEADLIILDRNILEIGVNNIADTQVEKTYLRGKIVFEK